MTTASASERALHSRLSCWLLLLAVAVGLLTGEAARAHPVAQGQLSVAVGDTSVTVRATVALEQAIIANAFGRDGLSADSTAAMLKMHGDYLTQHIRVLADQQRLPARVVQLPADPGPDAQSVSYSLEYDLRAAAVQSPATAELRIEQDVLNEIEFAPGNRWEATYLMHVSGAPGGGEQRRLLTSEAPLVLRAATTAQKAAASAADTARRTATTTSLSGALPDAPADAQPVPQPAPQSDASTAPADNALLLRDYLRFGVLHILTGYDHLLFIAALVLATVTLWDLIKIVSAFTLAHSLTLTLSVLGIVRLSENVVEPVIAASIVLVALDNLFRPRSSRNNGRLAIAFGFGLFHGLGFAGGLLEAMQGLGGATVALAIIAFSIGVELGHQFVVLPLFGLLALSRRQAPLQRTARSEMQAHALRYGSGAILIAGSAYLFAALRMA